MELLRPSACCSFCSRSSTSEWAILKRSSRSLFSCSCGSTRSSQLYQSINHLEPETDISGLHSCLCSHQLLYPGHFRNVRVDPQLQFVLLVQSLLHLHMYSLHRRTMERSCCYSFIVSFIILICDTEDTDKIKLNVLHTWFSLVIVARSSCSLLFSLIVISLSLLSAASSS